MRDLKRNAIKTAINLIQEAIATETSLNRLCIEKVSRRNYVANLVWEFKDIDEDNLESSDIDLVYELKGLYSEYLTLKGKFVKENKRMVKPLEYDSMTDGEKKVANYDAYDDEDYDKRSYGEAVRDGEEIILNTGVKSKKITSYFYNIKVKNTPDLIGELTREEMDMIDNTLKLIAPTLGQ
jgi:hypothetical protein